MGKSRPTHCSDQCPFWEKCAKGAEQGAKQIEAPARIAEHSLTACSCLMGHIAMTLWSKRLRQIAALPAQMRNVVNIVLASTHWLETGHKRKEARDLDHLVHTLVPLAVVASWLKLRCATPLKHFGGCVLVAGGLWKLYTLQDAKVPTELANDLLETPAEQWLPEVVQAAIGIGSGIQLLYAEEA